MSEFAKELGQRIRQLRLEKKMSQEELAFKSGLSAAHLGQIERALKNPTVDTVGKIASALGMPPAALFSAESNRSSPQGSIVEKINAHLMGMEEETQKDVLRIVRILHNYERKQK